MIKAARKRKQFKQQHTKQLAPRIELIPISRKGKHTYRRDLVSIDPWDLSELTKFFASSPLPASIRINSAVMISDVKLFVESHFDIIRANNGNQVYFPYLHRLQNVKAALMAIVPDKLN